MRGAIFCVAVFSLYLMLDRVQHDPGRRQSGGNFPRSQISVLQNRIEQLEQLLEENHQIISHIKDSVMELTDTGGAASPSGHLPFRSANGSWVLPFDGRPSLAAIKPQDCQFAVDNHGQSDLQMLDVYSLLKFDNPDGGVWKQGFEITYEPGEWDAEPLQVFVVPHSHNDPGWIKTFDKYYTDQTQHILNNMVLKLAEEPRRRFICATMPYLLKRANLTSMLIQRVHYSIKKHFASTRSLEFMWRQSWATRAATPAPHPKSLPGQFDFKRLPGGRVNCPWKVPPKAVWDQQFSNYQRLFDYMNAHPQMHVQGSRPADFPVVSGDFFAYADREDHYWTGYFTSRPFYKTEILYSLAVGHARHAAMEGRYPVSDYTLLVDARRTVALFQHHDAITGTAKENVVRVIINAAHFLVMKNKEFYRFYQTEPFLETDDHRATQDALPQQTLIELDSAGPRYVVLYNPVEQERVCAVSVLVNSAQVRMLTEDGQTLPVQLSAQWTSATQMSPDVFKATFTARLPALGLAVFHLYQSADSPMTLRSDTLLRLPGAGVSARAAEPLPVRSQQADPQAFYISSQALTLGFSGTTGLLESIRLKDEPQEVKLQMQFLMYGTRPSKDKSGAYLFLPDGKAKTVRIHNVPGVDGLSVELSTTVDIRDQANKELAMRLVTDIQSGDVFHTDLNGFQMQARRQFLKLPLQANFYPMPSQAYIQDGHHRLSLHSAQALGVASLESGATILNWWSHEWVERESERERERERGGVLSFGSGGLLAKLFSALTSLLPPALRRRRGGGASEQSILTPPRTASVFSRCTGGGRDQTVSFVTTNGNTDIDAWPVAVAAAADDAAYLSRRLCPLGV
ncbi:hypothetical protein CRUP_005998 [Coryphaenoides rupestris]|nr:hypothetical protein CRUP_005998 [Coryphaenoides rupestris]